MTLQVQGISVDLWFITALDIQNHKVSMTELTKGLN